jgi:hypothetical protein
MMFGLFGCEVPRLTGIPTAISRRLPPEEYRRRVGVLEKILAALPTALSNMAMDYFLGLPGVEKYSSHMDCLFLDPEALKKPGIFKLQPRCAEIDGPVFRVELEAGPMVFCFGHDRQNDRVLMWLARHGAGSRTWGKQSSSAYAVFSVSPCSCIGRQLMEQYISPPQVTVKSGCVPDFIHNGLRGYLQ